LFIETQPRGSASLGIKGLKKKYAPQVKFDISAFWQFYEKRGAKSHIRDWAERKGKIRESEGGNFVCSQAGNFLAKRRESGYQV